MGTDLHVLVELKRTDDNIVNDFGGIARSSDYEDEAPPTGQIPGGGKVVSGMRPSPSLSNMKI